jgi:hypothetical protein
MVQYFAKESGVGVREGRRKIRRYERLKKKRRSGRRRKKRNKSKKL